MNITFMIGNGFDLHCGLKTSYKDFYKYYLKKPSASENIKKFKKRISADIETWSDFEKQMGEDISNYLCENDYLECIRDFRRELKEYIKNEEKHFYDLNYSLDVYMKAKSQIAEFYNSAIPSVRRELYNRSISGNVFNYISFNYTSIADIIFGKPSFSNNSMEKMTISLANVIHVHGNLNGAILIGVDNDEQFGKHKWELGPKTRRAFVKPYANDNLDNEKVEHALNIIRESDVICIYGMSLGPSDKTWIDAINAWLNNNYNNHLFIYQHDKVSKIGLQYDEELDLEEDAKIKFIEEKLSFAPDIYEIMQKKIHIPIAIDLFDNSEFLKLREQGIFLEKIG